MNGTQSAGTSAGLTSSSSGPGDMIDTAGVPATGNSYEVKMTLNLLSSGGYYLSYLRASQNALLTTTSAAGTAYVVYVEPPTISGNSCSAMLSLTKMVNGGTSTPARTTIPCNNGMTVRSIITASNVILVFVNNILNIVLVDSDITSGYPGVAVLNAPPSNGISRVDIGPYDSTSPNAVNGQKIGISAFPNRVYLQWQGVADDTKGTGVY